MMSMLEVSMIRGGVMWTIELGEGSCELLRILTSISGLKKNV